MEKRPTTEKTQKCPRCLKGNMYLMALSRHDNKTFICNDCGSEEACVNMAPYFGFSLTEEVVEREMRIPLRAKGRWFDVHPLCRPLELEAMLWFFFADQVET